MEEALGRLAKRDRLPQASKAAELLLTALETEEDLACDTLAQKRDSSGARFKLHRKAWA